MKSAVVCVWCVLLIGLIAVTDARRARRPRFCYLPAETGHCKARMPKWYYNCKTCRCERFIYGGCGGNRNRFETERACRRRCKAKCVGLVDCNLCCPSGFVKDRKGCPICRCINPCENVHCSSREQCVERTTRCTNPPCPVIGVCVDWCDEPKKSGPCYAYFKRWFFNKNHCEEFVYGGCEGNANNFPTKEICRKTCQCTRLTCDKECEFGFECDKSGCPTCKCLIHPCAAMYCGKGYTCVPLKIPVPCWGEGSPPRAKCVKVKHCPKPCEFGYAFDDSGNPTCECLGNPCAFTLCQQGYQCVPQIIQIPCTGMGCPLRAKCIKAKRGRCPQYRDGQGQSGRRCYGDVQCPGRQKCCAIGPDYQCMNPV